MKARVSGAGGWVLPILFVGIFIVSTGIGVSAIITEHAFLSKAELDDGTITDYQVDSSGKSVEFCPIIDFTTKAGEPHEYEGSDCENHPQDVIIGKHVQVWYDPEQPHRFQTFRGSVLAAYLDVSFPILFGLLFLGIAGLLAAVNLWQALGARRRRQQAQSFSPPASDSESSLLAEQARLKAAEAEIQRKLEARRRNQGQ